jgi:hypothetical protein
MRTGSPWTDKVAAALPEALAWPLSALSTLLGFTGAGLVLFAAATGSIPAAIWAAVAFAIAAVTWHLAEFAADES